jgi:L-threonylcarbamoyladenylate synthase
MSSTDCPVIIEKNDSASAGKTVALLKSGEVAVLPTDTVYGFSGAVDFKGVPALCTDAKIRAIKGRSETKPFIHLIAKPEDIHLYTDERIPENILCKWPGPLTVIVPLKKDSPLDSGAETVAFRCPGDAWLRGIIEQLGCPVYSTSVNRSGFPVMDNIEEIVREFSAEVALVVKASEPMQGVPSTIISVCGGLVKVIRQGSVKI